MIRSGIITVKEGLTVEQSIKRRIRISTLLLSLLLIPVSLPATNLQAPRLNFVVIVADDLGWADVGFHKAEIRTPNLDRLAQDSLLLEQFYVAPMCSPTRAALLTGRYWSRFGVTVATNDQVLPFGTVTLASALRSAGYETAMTGKWHLGSKLEWGPLKFGFDHSYGSLAGGVGPYNHCYKKGPFSQTWHRDDRLIEEQGHVTDLITQEAIRWIESRSKRPFFLYVPFTAPHIPIDEPQPWLAAYSDIKPLSQQHHAACVSHLDDAIGRILSALRRTHIRDNTVVIFFSDNGAADAGLRMSFWK
jgi:arylsulfatase A-like enzyme